MAGKKATFTCKICGQEHAGLICTKFSSVRVVDKPIDRVSRPRFATASAPITKQLPPPTAPSDVTIIEVEAIDVTKPVTKPKGGRPATSGVAKTAAQRKADSRAKAKAAKV